jgi:6-phosphogluconolactonase
VHKGGKWVFSSNYSSGHIAVLPVEANGGVGAPDPIKGFPQNAHQIISDPAGKFVFVCATGPNQIAQFAFNETTGKLTPNDPATVMSGPGEPRHLAFHPNEQWAYHINERTSAVVSWKYDKATGKLIDPEVLPGLPAGFSGSNSGAHVVVHPNGNFVYSSNRGHNSITIWAVNATTGRLTQKGRETGMISTPRDFGVDPTGTFLIVANQGSGNAVVYRIKPDGTLTREGSPVAMPQPTFVGFLNL